MDNRDIMKKALCFILLFLSVFSFGFENSRKSRRGPQERPGHSEGHDKDQYRYRRNGHIDRPVRISIEVRPGYIWKGDIRFYEGYNYCVWTWSPYAPFYSWTYYYGWEQNRYYYIPEGMKCTATNSYVPGVWNSTEIYYSSGDAVDSALGKCESDPNVISANAESGCRIRNCVNW